MDIADIRLVACGFFLEEYPRYETLWQALERLDLQELRDLRDLRTRAGLPHRSAGGNPFTRFVKGAVSALGTVCRLAGRSLSVIREARRSQANVIFVFPGNYFMAVVLGLSKWCHHSKVYFDLYTSAYSAARTHAPGLLKILTAFVFEWLSARVVDRIVCLSPEYGAYYQKRLKVRADKFSVVHDGLVDLWIDEPLSDESAIAATRRVVYWGNFLVHHGFGMILDAAEILKAENVDFVFCGTGAEEAFARREAERRHLDNVEFRGFIPSDRDLIRVVDTANVTLGPLLDIHDTSLNEANKQKQGMARRKPVITVWTQQQEDLYRTKGAAHPAIVQISSDRDALVEAIRKLVNDPAEARRIGEVARETVVRLHGIAAITANVRDALEAA